MLAPPVFGHGLMFMPGGHLDCGELPILRAGNATIEAWVVHREVTWKQVVVSQSGAGDVGPVALLSIEDGRVYGFGDSNSSFVRSTERLEPESWHHLVLTTQRSPARVTLYVDGVRVDSGPQVPDINIRPVLIGGLKDGSGRVDSEASFGGCIARVRFLAGLHEPGELLTTESFPDEVARFEFAGKLPLDVVARSPYLGGHGGPVQWPVIVDNAVVQTRESGLVLMGGGDHVNLGPLPELGHSYTVESWFYPATASPGSVLQAGGALELSYIGQGLVLLPENRTPLHALTMPASEGEWTHVAVTCSDGYMRLYHDGRLWGEGGLPRGTGGAGDWLVGRSLNGVVRTLRVWDHPLSQPELAASMQAPFTSDARVLLDADFALPAVTRPARYQATSTLRLFGRARVGSRLSGTTGYDLAATLPPRLRPPAPRRGTRIWNTSKMAACFVVVQETEGEMASAVPWRLGPGDVYHHRGARRHGSYYAFYKDAATPAGTRPCFWQGRVGNEDEIDLQPEAGEVRISHKSITQADLDRLKAKFPENQELQNVTLAELLENSRDKSHDGSSATASGQSAPRTRAVISECHYAETMLIVDSVFIATGLSAIREKLHPSWIEHIAETLVPYMSQFEKLLMRIANEASSLKVRAQSIFEIVKLAYTAALTEAIFKAFLGSLTWWDAILYATLGLAELAAIFVTDGAALVALIVGELALVGFLVSDGIKAAQECRWFGLEPPVSPT